MAWNSYVVSYLKQAMTLRNGFLQIEIMPDTALLCAWSIGEVWPKHVIIP